jgi:hypothetical protein
MQILTGIRTIDTLKDSQYRSANNYFPDGKIINGPDVIDELVNREVTLSENGDGRLFASHPERIADLLGHLKNNREIAAEYSRGNYFPSVERMLEEVSQGKTEFGYIWGRYPRWVVYRALMECRIAYDRRGNLALPES